MLFVGCMVWLDQLSLAWLSSVRLGSGMLRVSYQACQVCYQACPVSMVWLGTAQLGLLDSARPGSARLGLVWYG